MKRIGILGHVGTKNLGDEAIVAAVIQQIRDRYPDAEIIAFTIDPEDTKERHRIPAFPIRRSKRERDSSAPLQPRKLSRLRTRIKATATAAPRLHAFLKGIESSARRSWGVLAELRFLTQCCNHLKGIDLLIVAGSNQLNDYFGGPWAFPYTLLKWCILAKWVGAKVAFLCCGAGPLDSRLGKLFIRCSLSLADCRSYRDASSQGLIERIGVSGNNPVCTDLAYGLTVVQPAAPESVTRRLVVGINPLPFCDERYWPEDNRELYRTYVRKLADFALWLNERGHSVLFFPTQLRADPPVIEDIRGLLRGQRAVSLVDPLRDRPLRSLDDLIATISAMDLVVATRYHGVLLSALLRRPILAVAYLEKTRDLMAQLGQSGYVVDINSFDTQSLATRFVVMESKSKTIRREIDRRTKALRQALRNEYGRMFRLLEGRRGAGAADEGVAALARLNGVTG